MLTEVLFVPGAPNLLSIAKAAKESATFEFSGDSCRIQQGQLCAEAMKSSNGLYMLGSYAKTALTMVATSKPTAELWHRRLAHLGYRNLAKLVRDDLIIGIKDLTPAEIEAADKTMCEPCIMGKHHRAPFESSTTKTTKRLELLHMDLSGPMPVESLGGSKYYATVLDDYSGLSIVRPIKRKTHAAEFVKESIILLETQTGERVRKVRTDNGGEYINDYLGEFFKSKGIIHETTAPYTPEQNGKAERLNRTINEKACALLADAGLEQNLWGEAVMTANYARNRSPSTGKDKTPWELMFKIKPDISHMRVFGARAYIHVPKDLRRKLDFVSERGTFIGYEPNTKGYRILLDTGVIKASRDVIFDEDTRGGAPAIESNKKPPAEPAPGNNGSGGYTPAAPSAGLLLPPAPAAPTPPAQDTQEPPEESSNYHETQVPVPLRSGRVSIKPKDWWVADPVSLSAADPLLEPTTWEEAMSGPYAADWLVACEEEMASLKANNTWELVELPGDAKAIPLKWVFKVKKDDNGDIARFKARLVAKGYMQREGIDYEEVFAPVGKYTTLRTLMALAAGQDLHLHLLDIKTAFLNGDLEETVYVKQPTGFALGDDALVCKLNRALYGLHQAPRAWHERLKKELDKHGFEVSAADAGLYTFTSKTDTAYILVYVDDILMAAKELATIDRIKDILMNAFDARDLGEATVFLGITIARDWMKNLINLAQARLFTEMMDKLYMESANTPSETIT
jgi:transposase InsO family protein